MIDWGFIALIFGLLVTYSIGRGIGIAHGQKKAPALRVVIQINGDDVGGFTVTDGRAEMSD